MDGVTERKITSLILAEAARLKRQADEEGVRAYLNPKVRYRPNARFLQATVRGVEQANRVAQMNEMWRQRSEEGDSRDPIVDIPNDEERNAGSDKCSQKKPSLGSSQSRTFYEESSSPTVTQEAGDIDMENFLQSRKKRGRGAVGARMDTTGPYPIAEDAFMDRILEQWESSVAGPAKVSSMSTKIDKWQRGETVEVNAKAFEKAKDLICSRRIESSELIEEKKCKRRKKGEKEERRRREKVPGRKIEKKTRKKS